MKIEKLSQLLAVIGWGSVFAEEWLLILRMIPSDSLSWGFYAFFLIVAIMASSIAAPERNRG